MARRLTAITALIFLISGVSALCAPEGRTLHVIPGNVPDIDGSLQFRTISDAAQAVRPGDTVLIHSGTYRESVTIKTSGTKDRPITFESAPGAHVVVTGADRITNWRKEGDDAVYSTEWPYEFIPWSETHTHGAPPPVGRCEQVFVQNYALQQVLSRDKVGPGTFFADLTGNRLYVCSPDSGDLTRPPVEASTRDVLWACSGEYVTTRGICFRYAANRAQMAAAQFTGRFDLVECCVFERTNGIGAGFGGSDITVRRCTFQDNGQMGFSAGIQRLLFTECLVRNNNTKDFPRGWEAGGDKICMSKNVIIEKSRFIDNRGTGVWFDIGNEDCTVRNCLISGNEDAGIFYEISYGLHAHDNVITRNGWADTPGSWGATAGISLSSSPGCLIERNLLVGNAEGFSFREQGRTTPRIGHDGEPEVSVWNHDEVVRNNVLAYNGTQAWGWFDVTDERHWPSAMQTKPAEHVDDKGGTLPVGLSLEKLKISMQNNLYCADEGQGLLNWGPSWARNRRFTDLALVNRELGLEQGSRVGEVTFADWHSGDLRVPAGSLAITMKCYPRGSVPGVRLGVH